ncbi:helix-turn-helix transcriptional regulator [Chryseolinea lacunae]|uniref:Helix-turn-helix transcriptional regulator n=1 Tax=Chryseolinea lacunae TaxID=2801331 RepID=A0ABS1KLR8_9BACT|nr:AraC family transcriptional regulator [Chryseolinea lacunae]MBL0740285.1 helix-turn-helix transcriptional regulator [Chryseolinea lacunae]
MTRSNFITVDYACVLPPAFHTPPSDQVEFATHAPIRTEWGTVDVKDMVLPEIRVVAFDSQVNQNLHLQQREGWESNTVDTCIFLDGTIESDFAGLTKGMVMHKGMHNFVYKPDVGQDHYLTAQERLNVLHLSVDRLYYCDLLCEKERWSASLKEKLLNRQAVSGAMDNMQMSPRMFGTVHDIMNCTLSGNLRKIVIEAKVLELIAMQLDQLVKRDDTVAVQKINSKDQDAFYALRDFLHQSFTEDHSLKNLSRTFGLNEFKLKKGFKELFGTTVFDYLHDLKMEHARRMLQDAGAYVNEVSGMVGYKNPNHFSTAFKRKFGINPAQYRN